MASATETDAAALADECPPLENGERLDQKTFHARYERMGENIKAELIGGKVYIMAPPVSSRHGRPHSRLTGWLEAYALATPGTDVLDNTTTILGDDSEPQPDACLIVLPEYGGRTVERTVGWIEGPPELVVEVASSSQSYDLHEKRDDYERFGAGEYLVFAEQQKSVHWWVRRNEKFAELTPGADGVIRSEVFPGLWLSFAALVQSNRALLHNVLRQGLASPEHAAFVARLQSSRK